jgi:hypothetical protein
MKTFIRNTVIFLLFASVEVHGSIRRSGRKARTLQKKIKAALNWPTVNADKLIKGRHIELKLTGNALFPIPYPSNIVTLVDLGKHIDNYEDAMAAGNADLTLETETIVHEDLTNIMTMVQIKMDGNKSSSETICEGAGYDVGKEIPHGPRTNSIETGAEPGTAILYGVGPGFHEWEISYDKGATSKPLRPTSAGKKTATGLTPSTDIWQRNCQVFTNETYGEWTDWVKGKTG